MSRYLVPCQCGQKLQVTTAQAGEDLPCSCGRTVAVPTLRGLQSFERVDADAPAAAARQWNFRAGLGFLGVSIAVVGLLLAGAIHFFGPKLPTFQMDEVEPVDLSSPSSIVHALANISESHIATYHKPNGPELQQMKDDIYKHQFWQQVSGWIAVAAGCGAVIAILSFFLPKPRGAARPLPRSG